MTPDLSAQIIANAWSDDAFAVALRGPDPHRAIRERLGVSLPITTAIPAIPPMPDHLAIEDLGVSRAIGQRTLTILCLLSLSLLCGHPEPEPEPDPEGPMARQATV